MFSEILVDHTTVHALRAFSGTTDQLTVRANELLQLVESLLLSDVVWICDTVTTETMRETMQYYKLLLKHHFASSRSDGKVRIAQFSPEQILAAIKAASPLIKDTVTLYGVDDWLRLSGTSAYSMRPSGAQPFDFHSLATVPFGSQQAEDYIQVGLHEVGWKTAALAPLLNAPLHLWLQGMVASFPDPNSPVYDALNTVFRWRYNEQLAVILSGEQAQGVDYVPAIGRARAIEHLSASSLSARLRQLQQDANQIINDRDELRLMFGGLGSTIDYPLPLFGAWAVSQLNPGCTLDHLIEKIGELKSSPEVTSVKRWLMEADSASIGEFAGELRKRLRTVEIDAGDPSAEGRLKIPNPLVWLESYEGPGDSSMSLDALRRHQTQDGSIPAFAVSTILASMTHDVSVPVSSTVLARVRELLCRSRDEVVPIAFHRTSMSLEHRKQGAGADGNTDLSPSNPASNVAVIYMFRKTSGSLWEIRYPGDKGDFYPDRKGFSHFHELLRAKGRMLTGIELRGDGPAQPINVPRSRDKRIKLGARLKQEQLKLSRIEEALLHGGNDLSFLENESLVEEQKRLSQTVTALRMSQQELADEPDPNKAAAQSARLNMTRALEILQNKMPLLVAHLDHCRGRNNNSFRYDPGLSVPEWILE